MGRKAQATISSLTPEQEALMPVYRDKWTQCILSTEPAQRKKAEAAAKLAYRCAGYKPPEQFVWCQSPAEQTFLHGQLKDKLGVILFLHERSDVWEAITDQINDHIAHHIWSKIGIEVNESVNGFAPEFSNDYSCFDYVRNALGLKQATTQARGLIELAQHAHRWWTFEHVCFLCERPKSISQDAQKRLHRADGLALEYRDGWGLYRWHGANVEERLILRPETITVSEVDNQWDHQRKLLLLECMGLERFFNEGRFFCVCEDEFGELYRRPELRGEGYTVVRVLNKTPEPDGSFKPYLLRVPPTITTPREAVAWSFGLREHEYDPEFES